MEETLLKANIPYKMVGGHKFYDRKEIKDILAYLNVLSNPQDSISFERIVNSPKRGIGPGSIENYAVLLLSMNGHCLKQPKMWNWQISVEKQASN